MLPRPASAAVGPKELISATVGITTPAKPTLPDRYSAADVKSIARSKRIITDCVIA